MSDGFVRDVIINTPLVLSNKKISNKGFLYLKIKRYSCSDKSLCLLLEISQLVMVKEQQDLAVFFA